MTVDLFSKKFFLVMFTIIIIAMAVYLSFSYNVGRADSVDYYPLVLTEMSAVKDATCWSCHNEYVPVTPALTSNKPVIGGKHPIPTACLRCHKSSIAGSYKFQYCTVCHYPPGSNAKLPKFLSSRHVRDPKSGFANILQKKHPLTTKHISTTTGCTDCHGNTLTNEHNKTERKDNYGISMNCNTCHTGSGLGERGAVTTLKINKTKSPQTEEKTWSAPSGKTVSRIRINQAMNARNYIEVYGYYNSKWGIVYRKDGVSNTWIDLPYKSTKLKIKMVSPYRATTGKWGGEIPEVEFTPKTDTNPLWGKMAAALDKNDPDLNTGCYDCHDSALNHESLHETTFDAKCQNCHNSSLSTEHKNRNKTCGTCHSSLNPVVLQAIKWPQKDCSTCHPQAHSQNLAPPVPVEIPFYQDYRWSSPQATEIWAGESWMPSEYLNGGSVIISDNRKDVVQQTVYDWYCNSLTAAGWVISSTENDTGYFKTAFTKGNKRACVVFTGNSSDGYKLKIIYKTLIN